MSIQSDVEGHTTSGLIDIGARKLYHEVRGSGPALLLITGGTGDADEWAEVAPTLAQEFTVVTYDRRGFSRSPRPDGWTATSMAEQADDAAALLRALELAPAAVVGHSSGGAIACSLVARHPEVVRHAVIYEAPLFAIVPNGGEIAAGIRATAEQAMAEGGPRHAMEKFMRTIVGDEVFESLDFDPTAGERILDNGAVLFSIELPVVETFVPDRDRMRSSGVPLTVVIGEENRDTWFGAAAAWLAAGTGADSVELPGGHVGYLTHPKEFVEVVRRITRPNEREEPAMSTKEEAMTTQELEQTRAAWDTIAEGYDRTNTPTQMWLGNEGLRRADLRAGMRFLDVASGSGALSIPAARLGAQVLATDQSPAMLELLDARARQEGLDIETRVMDGHALELDDNSFDLAGSQFGVMLFPDMSKGISEMARVVKPGGRVLMNVYGDPHKIEFFGFFVGAIQTVVPGFEGPPMDPLPLPFQLQDPERLRQEFAKAGLKDIQVETIIETTEFESGEHFWDWLVHSNPIVGMVLGELNLTKDQIGVVKKDLERQIRERAGDSGPASLTNPINIGVGTK